MTTNQYKGSGYFFATENANATGGWGIGTFFSSVANKIKDVYQSELNQLEEEKRKIATEAASAGAVAERTEKIELPWEGVPEEVKQQILSLTKTRRTFCDDPPASADFDFDMEEMSQIATAALEADPKLNNARFYLVPKFVREPRFWRNYFYRVHLIKTANGCPTFSGSKKITESDQALAVAALEKEKQQEELRKKKEEEKRKQDEEYQRSQKEGLQGETMEERLKQRLAEDAPIFVGSTNNFISDEWDLNALDNEISDDLRQIHEEKQNTTHTVPKDPTEEKDSLLEEIEAALSGDI